MRLLRPLVILLGLIAAWQIVVMATGAPHYILPGPAGVARALLARWPELIGHAGVTVLEILLGLALGALLGCVSALVIASFRPARRWLLPVLVVSQAIPVFALAPVLVLWLGYGLASKVAMATLIIYFPVTAAFFDGLRRTEPGWLDLARTMGGSRSAILRHVQVPAALPALAGLGYMMLQANARMQVDVMFAALFLLAVFAVGLYAAVDVGLRRALPWQAEDGEIG
jgi:putative hydroxymethylpyrimidine transport system permease protein